MNQFTLIVVSAFALGLTGCSSSSGTDTTTAQPSTIGMTTAETNTTDTPTSGTESQAANPGTIPSPVIGEVLSLDVSDIRARAGYKIFAGGVVDPLLSANVQELYADSYMNIDFSCNDGSTIEYYPSSKVVAFDPAFTSTFRSELFGDGSRYEIILETSSLESGENSMGQVFDGRNLQDSSFIVGTSTLYDLVVDRIVQYEVCTF